MNIHTITEFHKKVKAGARMLCRRKTCYLDIAIATLLLSLTLSIILLHVIRKDHLVSEEEYLHEDSLEDEEKSDSGADGEAKKCCSQNVLNALTKGQWVINKTNQKVNFFLDDFELRRQLGLPESLHRKDLRCGINYPVANTKLPAACINESEHFCCNEETGWCGGTQSHCNHAKSTNYRNLIPAHSSSWIPKDTGCKMLTFTRESACQLMSDNGYKLIFIGDSEARRLFTAYLLFLIGNSPTGVLKPNVPLVIKRKCNGELQLHNSECRHMIFDSSILLEDKHDCGFNTYFLLEYFSDFQTFFTSVTEKRIKSLMHVKNTYIILSSGSHFNSNPDSFVKYYLGPLTKAKTQSNWPKILVETLPKVPSVAIRDQRAKFRDAVIKFCKENSLLFLDNFELSSGLRSYDGKHYGLAFHILKVKILLNFLNKEAKGC